MLGPSTGANADSVTGRSTEDSSITSVNRVRKRDGCAHVCASSRPCLPMVKALRIGDGERVARAGHGDVEQAAFLVDAAGLAERHV